MSEVEAKKRNRPVPMEITGLPDTYIKAKYVFGPIKNGFDIAGFEAGEPQPKMVTDPITGERKFRINLNGFVRVEKNGSCLILDTLFNRRKLAILVKPGKIKKPVDSKGEEFVIVETRPTFQVEDESIFDGLDLLKDAQIAKNGGKLPKPKKGFVPAAKVAAAKAAAEAERQDDSEGVGGGKRPEMAGEGDLQLEVETNE